MRCMCVTNVTGEGDLPMPGLLLKYVDAYCCYKLDGYKNEGANPVAHAAG